MTDEATEEAAPTIPKPGLCVWWWRVIQDLHMHDYSMQDVAEITHIPRTTLQGYKNLDVEPKHADGERLLALWRSRMVGLPPMRECRLRQGERVRK